MAELAITKVFFRGKDVEPGWLTPYIDSLLIPWMGSEKEARLLRKIDIELRYYRKAMEKKKFDDDDNDMPLFAFLCGRDEAPDLSTMFVTLSQSFTTAGYRPDREVGEQLDSFLEEHASDEWRDDKNLEWRLSAEDAAALFRLSCWTVRQLEHVAEQLTARNPHDIGIRDFFSSLRKFAYDQAMGLAPSAINPRNFYEELGCEYYCPDRAVTAFWKAIGYTVVNEKTIHPVDRKLQRSPPFLEMLGHVKVALTRQSHLSSLGLSERAATARLLEEINVVEKGWDKAMEDSFHLGPTVTLLETTERLLAQTKLWLQKIPGSSKRDGDFANEFSTAFGESVEEYVKASAALTESLKKGLN